MPRNPAPLLVERVCGGRVKARSKSYQTRRRRAGGWRERALCTRAGRSHLVVYLIVSALPVSWAIQEKSSGDKRFFRFPKGYSQVYPQELWMADVALG
jgi:hypothetical protein